ncbi:MAG: NUDIX hydrolase [Prevotella sp.]|nr:NUDIX hydrolase [Prevotella sp.]MBO5156715.1 NUDIX hydrolase [Prevotella sp.]
MVSYYHEQPRMLVSVDCIVFGFDGRELRVLIGKRQMDPGRGEWSVYGGFVRSNESIDDAANRVLMELAGLRNQYLRQVGAFGRIDRDPGERVISIVYYALINVNDYDEKLREKHGVEWMAINDLPPLYSDHRSMIQKARQMMRETITHEPIGFRLLPKLFTLTQLQKVYEAISGEELDKRNFRKYINDMYYLERTELIDKKSSKRGAHLYRFNLSANKAKTNI